MIIMMIIMMIVQARDNRNHDERTRTQTSAPLDGS